ncbi:MAG: type II toxin-antitoxin system RelE/ParE family toxin [Gammaproteobacteria bacterium]
MKTKTKSIRLYETAEGKVPYNDWMESIKDKITKNRIRARIDRIQLGNYGDHKSVGEGVNELRLDFGPGYRIYYADIDDVLVILFCGGNKNGQDRDIKQAKKFLKELMERSDE